MRTRKIVPYLLIYAFVFAASDVMDAHFNPRVTASDHLVQAALDLSIVVFSGAFAGTIGRHVKRKNKENQM